MKFLLPGGRVVPLLFAGRIETTMFANKSLFVCYLLVSIRRQKITVAYSTNDLLFQLLLNLRQQFLR
jgi:hypothetical protein